MSWILTMMVASILLLIAYCMHWRWTHKRLLELAAKVPGPTGWDLIRSIFLFMTKTDQQLIKIAELAKIYGDYFKLWLGPDFNIFVKNPDDIRSLLTSNKVNLKGPVYLYLAQFMGPGILTGGQPWRNHRKIVTPSYNKKSIQLNETVFNREAEELANVLCKKDPNKPINVYLDVVWATTQSVCQTLMGLSKEDSLNVYRMKEIVYLTHDMYSHAYNKMSRWWLQIPLICWLLGVKKAEDFYAKMIDDFSSDVIRKRQRDLEVSGVANEESLGVVDRYILCNELTVQELKWETFSLFTTSQEASAKIASGVLMVLAHLPEWQDKVYNEIVEVLGPHDCPVTGEQIKKLHILDMVYKETLRYLSIAAMIQRTVEDEVTIDNGNITLPKGTSLVILLHDLHRDERYWEDPHKIKPERFLPENVAKRNSNAFVPYSVGPMDCLGRLYAVAVIKTIIVRVLRKVQLESVCNLEEMALEIAISVKLHAGYNLKVKPRQHGQSRVHA